MKKLLLFILVITVFSGVVSNAQQDVTGTWQGTLQAGRDLRTVIKITKADAELKAVVYSIDQGGAPAGERRDADGIGSQVCDPRGRRHIRRPRER